MNLKVALKFTLQLGAGCSYSQRFRCKRSFPILANSRTSQFMFLIYLIEYQNVKIDSAIKL